jgi:hypothetical protein
MPQCQFLFSAVLYFTKVVHKIFSELDETKPKFLFFETKTESRGQTNEGQEMARPGLGAAQALAAPRGGVGGPGIDRPHPSAYKNPPYA